MLKGLTFTELEVMWGGEGPGTAAIERALAKKELFEKNGLYYRNSHELSWNDLKVTEQTGKTDKVQVEETHVG